MIHSYSYIVKYGGWKLSTTHCILDVTVQNILYS